MLCITSWSLVMNRSCIALLMPVVLLTACGGSGDGAGAGNDIPPPSAALAITPGNSLQVSQVAYQAVMSSGEIADLAGDSGLTASTGGNVAKTTVNRKAAGSVSTIVQQVAIGPTIVDCAIHGSLTVTASLANPLTLSAGDTITAEYTNCNDGIGEVIDGTLSFVVDAFDGDILTGLYLMTMMMEILEFQVATAEDVLMASGDGTATVDTRLAPYVEASVSGDAMVSNTNNSSEALTNYSSAQTFDGRLDPAPYTMIASATLDSSSLAGSIVYSTAVMFEGFGENYPNRGELLIEGMNSSARLIAEENGIDVRIEIDSDGDSIVDDTILTTWAELAAM
jgi:hypothetical protein